MNTRRDFLKKMTAATGALMLPAGFGCTGGGPASDRFGTLLPLRKLGATGEKVTMLGVGGFHVGWTTEEDAAEVIEAAIQGGIRFFDTAHNYAQGESEIRYGKYLVPEYRDAVFLMTKTQAKDGASVLEEMDLSLERLKTGHVDLLQLHSFSSPEDVDERIRNGVMDAILKIKEEGKARYIGFTGHQSPYAHLRMMEHYPELKEFSTLQLPVSIVDYASAHSFVQKTMPVAMENNLALLAMKTLADGRFFARKEMNGRVRWETGTPVIPDHASIRDALYFSWSLPISTLITGAENKTLLEEKIRLANDYVKLNEDERNAILERAAMAPDLEKVEYYKQV